MITKSERQELELLIDDFKYAYSNFKYALQHLTEQSMRDTFTEYNVADIYLQEFLDRITK